MIYTGFSVCRFNKLHSVVIKKMVIGIISFQKNFDCPGNRNFGQLDDDANTQLLAYYTCTVYILCLSQVLVILSLIPKKNIDF